MGGAQRWGSQETGGPSFLGTVATHPSFSGWAGDHRQGSEGHCQPG